MTLILNDIWPIFTTMIQASGSTDATKKILAINYAQQYLIDRAYLLGKPIDDFVSDPTNLSNLISTNYMDCPSDFKTLMYAWYRSGTTFLPFGKTGFISYADLISRAGEQFFNTDVTGTPRNIAVKEPKLYFDVHFENTFTTDETITGATSGATGTVDSVSGTTLTYTSVSGSFSNGEVIEGATSGTQATISAVASTTMTIAITGGTKEIKIGYLKRPDDTVYYDKLNLSSIVGTFTVGETIRATVSNSTAVVRTVESDHLTITSRVGTFNGASETILGATSAATADADSLTYLPDTLSWTEKYKYLLAEASALIYLHLKASNGVAPQSEVVDSLIEQFSIVNKGFSNLNWGLEK
jgi:hypothetical protein